MEIQIGKITSVWAETHSLSCDYHETTTSTNDLAKEDAFNGLDPIQLYVAEEQTHGRGRSQNQWVSPKPGSSLLSSWSFRSEKAPTPFLTARVGLALYHSVKATWPYLNWNLKAPNDLYIHDHKVAGLLVETISQGQQHRIIVGLGFNIFSKPDLAIATDLLTEVNKNHRLVGVSGNDWIKFLDRFLFEICAVIPEAHEKPDESLKASLLSVFNLHPKLSEKYSNFDSLTEDLWR